MQTTSPVTQRKRKLLLIIPLLAAPFLGFAFWALGGGHPENTTSTGSTATGLKTEFPDAMLKDDKNMTKLGYYERAHIDSIKLLDRLKKDPFYRPELSFPELEAVPDNTEFGNRYVEPPTSTPGKRTRPDERLAEGESAVYRKLAQLNTAINEPTVPRLGAGTRNSSFTEARSPLQTRDVDRLEQLMEQMQPPGGTESDPEIDQLNGMLEKIIAIQHPEKVKSTDTSRPNISNTLTISASNPADSNQRGFYGFDSKTVGNQTPNPAIRATVQAGQSIVGSGIVQLRLLQPFYIGAVCIPKGQLISATAAMKANRLEMEITVIQYAGQLYPVKLTACDLDGIPGISINGGGGTEITSDVSQNSASTLSIPSLDPSFQAQMATAGINSAKSLLRRKIKVRPVWLKAGTLILLYNQKQL